MNRRARAAAALLAAAAAVVPLALAAPVHAEGDPVPDLVTAPMWASGAVVVTFRSDPATCAAAGNCGLEGVTRWTPSERAELLLWDVPLATQTIGVTAALGAEGDVSTVVRRTVPGGSRVCSDAPSPTLAGDGEAPRVPRGATAVTLPLLDATAGIFGSVCPGPLPADLRAASPAARLDLVALRRRSQRLDFRGERPFAAGGLTGTVRSTVVVDVGRLGQQGPEGGEIVSSHQGSDRVLAVPYRVARVDGTIRADATGPADPAHCQALDACGARLTAVYTPRVLPGRKVVAAVTAIGSRRVRRGTLLAALTGRADARVVLGLTGALVEGLSATSTVTREGTGPCTATADRLSAFVLTLPQALADSAPVRLTLEPTPLGRCGGPFSSPAVLETLTGAFTARLTPAMLRGDVLVLRFDGPRDVRLGGYPTRLRSDLRIVLRRAGRPRALNRLGWVVAR